MQLKQSKDTTLRIEWPIGTTLLVGLVLLTALWSVGEVLLRLDFFESIIPAPSVATRHRKFEVTLGKYWNSLKNREDLDCLILGNSMAQSGINPEAFSDGYQNVIGRPIECFTFGVDGLAPEFGVTMARILFSYNQPRLLIYGFDTGSLDKGAGTAAKNRLLESPWIQYKLGTWNIEGWLIEHSDVYRRLLVFRNWTEPDFSEDIRSGYVWQRRMYPNGFWPAKGGTELIFIDPDPELEEKFFSRLEGFRLSSSQLSGLSDLAQLPSETQVVVVELPVHPTFVQFYENGIEDYERALSAAREVLDHEGVLFLTTTERNLIPDTGWKNRNHMNPLGADAFSSWLGEEIARRVKEGQILNPSELSERDK